LGITAEEPPAPAFDHLVARHFDCTMWIVTKWIGNPALVAIDERDEPAWCSLKMVHVRRTRRRDRVYFVRSSLARSIWRSRDWAVSHWLARSTWLGCGVCRNPAGLSVNPPHRRQTDILPLVSGA